MNKSLFGALLCALLLAVAPRRAAGAGGGSMTNGGTAVAGSAGCAGAMYIIELF